MQQQAACLMKVGMVIVSNIMLELKPDENIAIMENTR